MQKILPRLKPSTSLNELFYQPLHAVFDQLEHRYPCQVPDDELWLRIGIERVLEEAPSGRGFLQEHRLRFESLPRVSNYFESLKSRCLNTENATCRAHSFSKDMAKLQPVIFAGIMVGAPELRFH